jgi:hypothetical protein
MVSKKPKLTIKQAKFVKGVASGISKREAAKLAGYSGSPETLSVTASEVLKKPNVQEALAIALEKHGLSPDSVVSVVKDGMSATKVNIIRDPLGGEDSAFAEETPDHSIRLKAAGMAAQFMGIGKQATVEGGIHFHQHVEEKKSGYEF